LLYRTVDYEVEMRVEPEMVSVRFNIAGQVSSFATHGGVAKVPVSVKGRSGAIAQTSTNEYGEFALAVVPERYMRLSLDISSKRTLSIPLENAVNTSFYR